MKKTIVIALCAALLLAAVGALAESDLSGYFKTWTLDHLFYNGVRMSAADLGYEGQYVVFNPDGTVGTGTEGNLFINPWNDTGDGLMVNDSADDIYRLQPDGTLLLSYKGDRTNGNQIDLIFVAVEADAH